MHRAQTIMAVALFVVSAVLVREALRLPIGWTSIGPGSGFFPFWLSLGVMITAAVLVTQTGRAARPARDRAFIPAGAWKPLLVVFLPMAAVVAFIDLLGIYIGGGIYLAGYMWLVGRHRWVSILLVSVLLPLTLFFVFERWFLLPLPKGVILETILYGE